MSAVIKRFQCLPGVSLIQTILDLTNLMHVKQDKISVMLYSIFNS